MKLNSVANVFAKLAARSGLALGALLVAFITGQTVSAQDRIYRCGNAYTNTITQEQEKTCKLVSGGNVTVVQSAKPPAARVPVAGAQGATTQGAANQGTNSSGGGAARPETADQRAKEADARRILESELKKAEARQLELVREYNNGEPEKMGPEFRNHQKYLDRVAELKSAIARNESDIAGIRREIARLPGGATVTGAK